MELDLKLIKKKLETIQMRYRLTSPTQPREQKNTHRNVLFCRRRLYGEWM